LLMVMSHEASVALPGAESIMSLTSADSASSESTAEPSLGSISRCSLHSTAIAPGSREVREITGAGRLEGVGEAADGLGVAGQDDVVEPEGRAKVSFALEERQAKLT